VVITGDHRVICPCGRKTVISLKRTKRKQSRGEAKVQKRKEGEKPRLTRGTITKSATNQVMETCVGGTKINLGRGENKTTMVFEKFVRRGQ